METDLIYSDTWKEKDQDRKDFTYTPLSKNLKDVVCVPQGEEVNKILNNYIR